MKLAKKNYLEPNDRRTQDFPMEGVNLWLIPNLSERGPNREIRDQPLTFSYQKFRIY